MKRSGIEQRPDPAFVAYIRSGAVEMYVCAMRLSSPASRLRSTEDGSGWFPDVGGTV